MYSASPKDGHQKIDYWKGANIR